MSTPARIKQRETRLLNASTWATANQQTDGFSINGMSRCWLYVDYTYAAGTSITIVPQFRPKASDTWHTMNFVSIATTTATLSVAEVVATQSADKDFVVEFNELSGYEMRFDITIGGTPTASDIITAYVVTSSL